MAAVQGGAPEAGVRPRSTESALAWMRDARVSTNEQDLTAQRDALTRLGVDLERVYVDHGPTGTNRQRPGLNEALAACRRGDVLVVAKLGRLARSLPDARDIVADLTKQGVKLNIGGSVHDSTDPIGRLLFNVLAMVAEFEVMWTRRGTPTCDRRRGAVARCGSWWSGTRASYAGCA